MWCPACWHSARWAKAPACAPVWRPLGECGTSCSGGAAERGVRGGCVLHVTAGPIGTLGLCAAPLLRTEPCRGPSPLACARAHARTHTHTHMHIRAAQHKRVHAHSRARAHTSQHTRVHTQSGDTPPLLESAPPHGPGPLRDLVAGFAAVLGDPRIAPPDIQEQLLACVAGLLETRCVCVRACAPVCVAVCACSRAHARLRPAGGQGQLELR